MKKNSRSNKHLAKTIVWRPRASLRSFPGNAREHPDAQIQSLMKLLKQQWTIPILIDENGTILCGHARNEAADRLGMAQVPTLMISGLTDAEKRSVVISDNRSAEKAVWNSDLLRAQFQELIDIDINFDLELTGFSTGEIDLHLDSELPPTAEDEFAEVPAASGPAVSQLGDQWQCGPHRIVCGDAQTLSDYKQLLKGETAQLVLTDPPFNLRINSVMGRGKTRHREFVKASGELSKPEYIAFLAGFIKHSISASIDGAIHFLFIDWRHLPELLAAAQPQFSEWKNLLVWNKTMLAKVASTVPSTSSFWFLRAAKLDRSTILGLAVRGGTAPTSSTVRASTVCIQHARGIFNYTRRPNRSR